MRITTKFIGSSALLIVLNAALFGSSYAINRRSRQALVTSYTQSELSVSAVAQLEVSLSTQILALERLAILGDDNAEDEAYTEGRTEFFQALGTLQSESFVDEPLQQIQLKSIRRQHNYLEGVAQQLLTEDIQEEEAQEIIRALRIFEQSSQTLIRSLSNQARAQTVAYQKQQEAFYDQIALLELLGFGAGALLLGAQFRFLLRPVTRSLQQLQLGAEQVELNSEQAERGQSLVSKIQISTGDELQALAASFNQMSDRLRASYQNLEGRVAERTASLHRANQALTTEVTERLEAEASLQQALAKLKQTQLQLLQTEKMSSLGQLVAGVAHEINNPVSFIRGNLEPAKEYMNSLLMLISRYQAECPEASAELHKAIEQADLAFIQSDFPQLLQSMEDGAERIAQIVRSLQTFSHLDESETKSADLHEGLESSIFLLAAQLKATPQRPAIEIKRQYGNLPRTYCYPSQINQVFMGLLTNAVDALSPKLGTQIGNADANRDKSLEITITTNTFSRDGTDFVRICIADNGPGMSKAVRDHVFDPFFTTKPVGSGIGLGLSMSYQIVAVNHRGRLKCQSTLEKGTTFTVEIPTNLEKQNKPVKPVLTVPAMPGLLT